MIGNLKTPDFFVAHAQSRHTRRIANAPRAIVAVVVAVCLLLLTSAGARAQCIGSPVQTNQTCTNSGTLTNTSTFGANDVGLRDLGTLTVTNTASGIISGTSANGFGILVDSGNTTVTNSGSISGGLYGIAGGQNATVTNFGTISSTNNGVALYVYQMATVSNFGTITGGTGQGMYLSGQSATVTNSGTISGGITAVQNATVTNSGTISISGVGASIDSFGNVTVTNTGTGTISGGIFANQNATVTNSGSILGGLEGIQALNVTVTNSSTISGGLYGINAGQNAMVTNSSTISGGLYGINAGQNAMVTNSGIISGGTGISAGTATVINSGTITGSSGQAIAFTGGPNILELQAGSTITGTVVASSAADTFRLGGSSNASFDASQIGATAQYQGFGVFIKTGTSAWGLTGTNTALLPWTVQQGTLSVNGSLANSTFTVNGGTLGGTGTVGAVQINAGGSFVPGDGTPTTFMTVSGSLALASGAKYLVQFNPATSSLANVTGPAVLGGATVNASFAGGSYVSKQYTILTATGGVSGTFASLVTTNLPANFRTTVRYDANDAYLNLSLNFAVPTVQTVPTVPTVPNVNPPNFAIPVGLNVNQQNVGTALSGFFNTTGRIPLVFGTLTPAGLTQASGELATGSQQTTFDAMNLFLGLLTDPFIDRRGAGVADAGAAPSAYASTRQPGSARGPYSMFTKAPVTRWSVWAAGFGGSQTTDGNPALGSNPATSNLYSTAVGADYRFSPDTLAGFALAGGGTSFGVANGLGSGRSDLFQAGAYVRHAAGPAYISAALAYGWQHFTTNRTVSIAGIDQLQAGFDANAFSGRVESGYRYVSRWIGITPYAAAQFTTFDLPGYAESVLSGAGTFALNYNAKDVTDSRSELGIRTDRSWAMQNAILTLRSRVAWAHDFDPDRSMAATFQTLPGASFVVNGAAQARDSALTTASAEIKWIKGWSAAATFEGAFSNATNSYAGKGVVRYIW